MATPPGLIDLDAVSIHVIIDNELDPISASPNPAVIQTGSLKDIAIASDALPPGSRGTCRKEFRMDEICCSAHGLSLLITGTKDGVSRTVLFDTGPEEGAWERNIRRMKLTDRIADVELVHLSHWHIDHSGGMLQVLRMLSEAKAKDGDLGPVVVDLHPERPAFRGFQPPGMPPFSMQADPTFEEIEELGAVVSKNDQSHTVLNGMFLVSGEIPRVTPYETGLKFGVRFNDQTQEWEEDTLVRDERLLMCKVKGKGIVMFTGCSHAGVVNASKYAAQLGGGAPLYAVMGGYHLADADAEKIQSTVEDLKALDAQILLCGHCTGWRAKFEIQNQMPGRLVPSFVGSRFEL